MKYYNLNNDYLKKLNQIASELKIYSDNPIEKIIPSGNNSQNSFQLFYQRLNYRITFEQILFVNIKEPNSFKDTIFVHDLYGKINHKGSPIFIDSKNSDSTNISNVKNLSCEKKIKLLNFAAEAYDELFEKHKQLVQKNIISPSSKFADIVPKIGWMSANDQHQNFISLYFINFIRYIDANNINKKILNFKSFINIFINFYNLDNVNTLINKSEFIRSNLCTIFANGLTIEFTNDDHGNDLNKYNNYLKDPNFGPFSELTKQYGFVMDKNYPWRLVFDVNSQTGKKYLEKHQINNLEQLFQQYYYLAEFYDYDTLIVNLINLYNFISSQKKEVINIQTEIKNNKICISNKTTIRKQINSVQELIKDYMTEQELMEIFFYTKCVENNLVSTESEFQQYLSEINTINKFKDKAEAFEHINKLCSMRKNKGDSKFRRTFYSS